MLRRLAIVLALLLSALAGTEATAQGGTQLAAMQASAQVMPLASFEGGATHSLEIPIVAGKGGYVAPSAGVRTRMRFAAPTLLTVSVSPFAGPDGASVDAELLCAGGVAEGLDADVPFPCGAGLRALPSGAGSTTIPVAVGARVGARAAHRLPTGLFRATVTLVGTQPGS